MKTSIFASCMISVFCLFMNSASAHPQSTLTVHYIGSAVSVAAVNNANLVKSSIQTLQLSSGSSDQFLVLESDQQAHCVISKAAAAKQGVSIEMLNDLANHYQVEVSCVYSSTSETASDNFGFRASMR